MLYGQKLKEILAKFGVDPSNLPDNLYSTLLSEIEKVNPNYIEKVVEKVTCIDEDLSSWAINLFDANCTSLVIPEGVTEIPNNFFENRTSLVSVTFPSTLRKIGDYAFQKCTKLTNVTFPDGLVEIGSYAFFNCKSIPELVLPSELIKLGGSSFNNCVGLKQVTFNNKLETIGSYAFYSCGSLESVTLPASVKNIADSSFGSNYYSLKEINVPWAEGEVANAPWGFTASKINYNYEVGD